MSLNVKCYIIGSAINHGKMIDVNADCVFFGAKTKHIFSVFNITVKDKLYSVMIKLLEKIAKDN